MLAKRKVSADSIAKSLGRYAGSVKTKARELNLILSRRLRGGEEMSATSYNMGPRWTPEEDGLLRSMAAAGESVAAITKPLKRSAGSVRKRARILKINLARSQPGPKPRWK